MEGQVNVLRRLSYVKRVDAAHNNDASPAALDLFGSVYLKRTGGCAPNT